MKGVFMQETIGFIGLGQMGRPLALNILKARAEGGSGFGLRVFDLVEERVTPLVALGAQRALSLREVGRPGGIVLSTVPDEALLDVARGEGGLLEQLGTGGIHLSLSTISPAVADELAELYAQRGSSFLVGTVLGQPEVDEAARLSIFLSGHRDAKERVLPVVRALGKRIEDLGEGVSAATVLTLGANFLVIAALEALGEAAAFVEAGGVDRARFLRAVAGTVLFDGATYTGCGQMIGARRYSAAKSPIALGIKDAEQVLNAAERAGLALPLARLALHHLSGATSNGGAAADWTALAQYATPREVALPLSVRWPQGRANLTLAHVLGRTHPWDELHPLEV